jgi:hypothetical protein
VGGDYQKENEPSTNFARSNDGGKTWTAGPQLPGYRSGIHNVSSGTGTEMFIAVGPSGTDFIRASGGWISAGTMGYDAVSFAPRGAVGWTVGQGGRIAKWRVTP